MNLAVCRPKTKKDPCVRDKNLHEYLEREAWRALQSECIAQRKLSDAETKRDRMIWDRRHSDWAATCETNSQLESPKNQNYIMQTNGLVKLR